MARQVAALSNRASPVLATTRARESLPLIEDSGASPYLFAVPLSDKLCCRSEGADILVSFPPDGKTDSLIAPALQKAGRIIYVSSTSVYGALTGQIDEDSPVDRKNPRALQRLHAEESWMECGAFVLRAPAIYSPLSGLHLRLKQSTYAPPALPDHYVSRIHLEDLAGIIVSMFEQESLLRRIYVCGDSRPSPHREVVEWLCKELNMVLPAMSQSGPAKGPGREISGNRQINAAAILQELGYRLKFPTFIDGYGQCLGAAE